jgi:hypothetical protein
VKSLVKKKANRCKTKPPTEKLPYEQSEEESKAAAQKDLDNWNQRLAESRARRLELQKNPPKSHYIAQRELRKKINEREKQQPDARKPSPLLDYERSLDKSYKESRKAKRAVAQLRQQSKQSMDPLVVEGDCANAQGSPIDKEALEDFMATTGLTAEQLMGEHRYQQETMIFTGPMCMARVLSTLSTTHH